MTFKSISLDPVSRHDERTEELAEGVFITRNSNGEIIRTVDRLGVKREYSREWMTGRLMLQRFGNWTKLTDGRLESDGTLIYTQGEVEIEERLDGIHIHINQGSGVSIQTDHITGVEVVRQPHGEVWRRERSEHTEIFEIYVRGKLTFRTQTLNRSIREQAKTPYGGQALVNVSRREQSCENGQLVREKFSFTNPLNQQRDIMLTLQCAEAILILKKVVSVTTAFVDQQPTMTSYQLSAPSPVRFETAGKKLQYTDIVEVVELNQDGVLQLLVRDAAGTAQCIFN